MLRMLGTRNSYARQADRPLRLYVNGSMKAIQLQRVRQDGKGKEGWMRQTSEHARGRAPGRRRKIPAGIRGIRG